MSTFHLTAARLEFLQAGHKETLLKKPISRTSLSMQRKFEENKLDRIHYWVTPSYNGLCIFKNILIQLRR